MDLTSIVSSCRAPSRGESPESEPGIFPGVNYSRLNIIKSFPGM
jgi:hypothetical protein